MTISDLLVGDEVIVFTNYGRECVSGVIAALGYCIRLEGGEEFLRRDVGRTVLIAKTDSDDYRLAVKMQRVNSIVSALEYKDKAIAENADLFEAIEKIAGLLGEDVVAKDNERLVSMGAAKERTNYLYHALRR